MPLDRRKLSLVHVAKAKLRLDEKAYRQVLQRYGGVESARGLDEAGFNLVMECFHHWGFTSDAAAEGYGYRRGMASFKQVHYIRDLWLAYTDHQGDDTSLNKWLSHIFKIDALRFVDAELAPKVIAALRNMNERKAAKSAETDRTS